MEQVRSIKELSYLQFLQHVCSRDESLDKRLANVENELGVFFMNQGTALLDTVTGNNQSEASIVIT